MEELWNKLGAWGYAVPILMLLCLNILCRKAEPEDCLKRTREK